MDRYGYTGSVALLVVVRCKGAAAEAIAERGGGDIEKPQLPEATGVLPLQRRPTVR
jgi:hypothetical protein